MQSFVQKHPELFRSRSIIGGLTWLAVVLLWIGFMTGDTVSQEWLLKVSQSPYTAIVFVLVGVIAMLLLLPGIMITIGAGYLFGLFKGIALVVLATTIGASIAFWLGRRVLNKPLLAYLDGQRPLLFILNNDLRAQGGKLVFLTRLIPLFPFKLSNYYFGAADYKMRGFVIGTALGIIPITIFNVYVGAALADISQPLSLNPQTSPPLWLTLVGGIALACLIVIISRQAARSLGELKAKADQSTNSPKRQKHV